LHQKGWSVWWDRTILPGKTWDQVIEKALADARCVIVLWSRASIRSDWVRTEAEEAKERGILVPALLDDVSIPLAFKRIQAANLGAWSGVLPSAEFDELARAVSAVLSEGAPSALEATARLATGVPAATAARGVEQMERGEAVQESGQKEVVAEASWERESQGGCSAQGRRTTPDSGGAETGKRTASAGLLRSRRTLVLIGVLVLVCIAGFAWYLATSPRRFERGEVQPNPKDGLGYVWIPPGKFTMGCSPGDGECRTDEPAPHEVAIARGFWLGQTEVTQAAFERVMGANPSGFKGAKRPVENVTWGDANEYCRKVGGLRLPTEEEWEYAARAGNPNARYGELGSIAWYGGNSGEQTHEVKLMQPNTWGLYDMLGNVWEWTSDLLPNSNQRILRGGSVHGDAWGVRVSFRNFAGAGANVDIGFRCAGELY